MAKILVIDDSTELLELFSLLFSMKGFEVRTADSKNKLINQLSVFAPDIILLDVLLNDADGRQLCREIRQINPGKNLTIILLSASAALLKDYAEYQADHVIEKPFEIVKVVEMVNAFLHKKIS